MDEINLPAAINYSAPVAHLPENAQTTLMSIQASNGTKFAANSVVQFDLPSRNGLYIDPKTIFIRYQLNFTSGATAPTIRATPVYTPIFRLDTFIGSQVVDSVSQYNQVANLWINSNLSVADKYGLQNSLGYSSSDTTGLMANLDGRLLAASQSALAGSYQVSAPVICCAITSLDKFIPTWAMPALRFQFTLDTLANIATTGSTDMTDYEIRNFELCFAATDFGSGVDSMVSQMGTLRLKGRGWANSAQSLASSSSGQISLQYSLRYKSIENAFLSFSGTAPATALNLWADSYDFSQSNGSIQLQVANQNFPQLPLSTINNKSGIQSYLRECFGSITDWRNSSSINNVEYGRSGNTTTTAIEPAKFIVGFPLSKLQPSNPYAPPPLMSGVDSSLTPIVAVLNTSTATATAYNVNLIVEYSCILNIDPMSKQVQIQQ
jgi:hypothetical protein